MKKIITVLLLVLSLLVLMLSGCTDEQMEIIPQQIYETVGADLVHLEEVEYIAIAKTAPDPEPSPEPIQVVEGAETKETTDNPQDKIISTPTETLAPVPTPKPAQSQTSVITPKPTQSSETTQAPNQTSAPAPQSTPELVQQSIPTPQPIPEPVAEPIPEPIPQPTSPPPPVTEPPSARTICNTCGADITGNLVEHGTAHLINDENFSYRNE